MNIIHVIPYFPPANRFGGAPEAVYQLAAAQAALDCRVTVMTTDAGLTRGGEVPPFRVAWADNKPWNASASADSMRIVYFPNRFPSLAERLKVFTPRFDPSLLWNAAGGRPDVLHIHEVNIPGYARVAAAAEREGIPAALSPHGSLDPPVHRGWKKLAHRLFDPRVRRGWFERIALYISLCRAETEQLTRLGAAPDRIALIPYGCPTFPEPARALPFEIEPSECPALLCAGRVSMLKGVDTLTVAFERLWASGFRARLIFCGHDEGAVSWIRRRCERAGIPAAAGRAPGRPGVCFLPAVPRACMPNLYGAAGLTVCPSPYESFGLAPVESVLCGTPALLTTAYGCLEHIRLDPIVLPRVPPGDAGAMAKGIRSFFENPRSAVKIRRKGDIVPPWSEIAEMTVLRYSAIPGAK